MLKYIFLAVSLLICSNVATAQSKEELELQKQFWGTEDNQKNIVEVPEKWLGESAVILYRDEYYKFTNNGKKMYNPSYFHQRVKLLDKSAVEDFSEYSFEKNSKVGAGFVNFSKDETTVGIKILKLDGEEIIVDIDAETVAQDDENKIAIPNLEVGDIVDLYVYEDDYLRSFSGTHIYPPVERVLSSDYPIVYSRVAVEVENDYFLNMESYNGAPKIKEEETDRKSTKRYVLEASDLDKSEFPRWFYPLTELPALKFQVTFALKFRNQLGAKVFLSEDDAERKTKVTNEEIIEYYGNRFNTSKGSKVRDVVNYLEDKGITDKRKQIEEALYYVRHKSYNRFIELVIARDNEVRYYPELCDSEYVILDEDTFVNYFAGLAKRLEIDFDIIVATEDYNGPIDDLLLRSNVSYGLRFNFDEPLYLFSLSPHVQADFFPKNLEGTKVYQLNIVKNRKIEDVSFDVLPVTAASENSSSEVVNIAFEDNFKKIIVDRVQSYTGHFKNDEIDDRLVFVDYLDEEFNRFETKHFYHCKKRQNKSDAEAQSKMEAFYASFREKKEEKIKENVGAGYDVEIEDYSYELVNTGRYSKDPLTIGDHFTISNEFVKKAGPNFLVEVGKFIGGQVQLKEEELVRTKGIYLDHAKTFNYEVNITIPDGYEVVGLDKLQRNTVNDTGRFVAVATIEDGILKYRTTKTYAKRNYPASDWLKMTSWLNEAYDFSQEKVMFRKI